MCVWLFCQLDFQTSLGPFLVISSLHCETGGAGGGTGSESMHLREKETLKNKCLSNGNVSLRFLLDPHM